MIKTRANCVLLLLLLCGYETLRGQNTNGRHTPVYIGLLDDAREEMVNWKPGVARERLVRPAFQRTETGWMKVDPKSFPPRIAWTVGFDGKEIGHLESRSNSDGSSTRHLTFVQSILSSSSTIPNVGIPKSKYAPIGVGPTKGRRPLVLVSRPYVSDPDAWTHIAQPSTDIVSAVQEAFRRDFPYTRRCKKEEIVQRQWKFPDSALRVLDAYSSNKGSHLVHVSLEAGDCGYVDEPNDPLSEPWYYLPAGGSAKRIGSFMTLLDAGDYDNDGRSEVIFMIEQPEDTEGFALYDADMHKRASLLWTYH